MASLGKTSITRLRTCHVALRAIVKEAIKVYDFSVVYGQRDIKTQLELFKKGRRLVNDRWIIIDKSKIVTNCDGYKIKSKHNAEPLSLAIDLAPYDTASKKILWDNEKAFYELAGVIKTVAYNLNVAIKWGGNFRSLKDLPHYELIDDDTKWNLL